MFVYGLDIRAAIGVLPWHADAGQSNSVKVAMFWYQSRILQNAICW